ncbi:MAG: FprA family A-type flavoprotein [Thermoplasmatota archaeon]
MQLQQISPDVYAAVARHWDRQLFDELIPLPDGTSYNAYLVEGSEATALIDTADPAKQDELLKLLDSYDGSIDILIANHAEQDHSGSIPAVLDRYPGAEVRCTSKCRDMLIDHLHVDEQRIQAVEDGDTLSLGDKTLRFIETPWVHWPETMSTYLEEQHILFPCDFFGSHLAASHLYVQDRAKVYEAAKRYYAEIMMPFRKPIKKNLDKLADIDIDMIAPSHGPIYRDPDFIMDAYREWAGDEVKNEVVLPYVSMHGSTRAMVDHLIDALIERGITVKPFNLTTTDVGQLAISLVDAATLVIASPTVLGGPHPAAVYAAYLANALRPKTRFAGIMGSYGWGGRMENKVKDLIGNLDVELLDPVIIKGYPRESDYASIDALADEILKRHEQIELTEV